MFGWGIVRPNLRDAGLTIGPAGKSWREILNAFVLVLLLLIYCLHSSRAFTRTTPTTGARTTHLFIVTNSRNTHLHLDRKVVFT
jgi:hypothetical protein